MAAADLRAALRQRPALGEVEPVGRLENRTIRGPNGPIDIRVYWPHGDPPAGGWPLVVFFHGGGWVICDLDSHDPSCRTITNAVDAVVVSVDYRLAPEHPFPAGPEDCFAGLTWAAGSTAELGADPARIVVAGDSAGGNLAAVVALMAKDRGGPALAGQFLVYPVIAADFDSPSYRDNGEGYFLTEKMMRWFWDQYVPGLADAGHRYVSPITADDLSGLPPAIVVTGELDPLRSEGEAYAAALAKAGVPTWSRCYEGGFHGFFSLFITAAKRAREESLSALGSLLAGEGLPQS
jgi:acetyl esterase